MAKNDKNPKAPAQANTFQQGDKTFEVVIPKMIIPGIGEVTAADVCANTEAQEYLVKVGSAAIREVEA